MKKKVSLTAHKLFASVEEKYIASLHIAPFHNDTKRTKEFSLLPFAKGTDRLNIMGCFIME